MFLKYLEKLMLTDRQQDTYDFISQYIKDYGRSPLLSEVAAGI